MAVNFRKEEEKEKKPETNKINVICTKSTLFTSLAFPKFLQFHTHLDVTHYSKFPLAIFCTTVENKSTHDQ